jgi:hypothetical protein
VLSPSRARAFPKFQRAGARRLDRLGPPRRGSGWLAGRDALSYGVSFATIRSHQLAEGDSGYSGLDDISVNAVSAVPEPSIWAMLLLAFVGIALLRFRDGRVAVL